MNESIVGGGEFKQSGLSTNLRPRTAAYNKSTFKNRRLINLEEC